MACSKKTVCISTIVVANSFMLIGIALIIGWPYLYTHIINKHLSLSQDSTSYEMWKETPIPMYLEVYLFNWTNAKQVDESKWRIKPKVEQCGPYVFHEHHERVNITFNKNDTITFNQIRTWKFMEDMSVGSLDDNITNLNVIAATVAYFVRHKHYLIRRAVDIVMIEKHESLYLTRTARELIFDGYEDELLDLLRELNNTSINIPFKKFGWFVERNESYTYDGTFTMYTGMDDLNKVGMMTNWNGYSHVPFYPGQCGDVVGTTGELWPPVVGNTSLYMFASDMCSTAILDLESPTELHGVSGFRYSGTNRTFDNGTFFPEQSCFSVGEPAPTGLRNVSDCKFGAPAFLSFPHFYLADPNVQKGVDGLKPEREKHELYLELEPTTGLPLTVEARAQVNLLVQPIEGIGMYEHVRPVFMPMMWFTQRATLTEDIAGQIKILLILPKLGMYTGIGITALAVFLLVVYVATTARTRKDNEGEMLITPEVFTNDASEQA